MIRVSPIMAVARSWHRLRSWMMRSCCRSSPQWSSMVVCTAMPPTRRPFAPEAAGPDGRRARAAIPGDVNDHERRRLQRRGRLGCARMVIGLGARCATAPSAVRDMQTTPRAGQRCIAISAAVRPRVGDISPVRRCRTQLDVASGRKSASAKRPSTGRTRDFVDFLMYGQHPQQAPYPG